MFQGLRQGNALYILSKREPRLTIAQVESVSNPQPKFSQNYTNTDMVVDISVTTAEGRQEYRQLPALATIANFGLDGMVISDSKDAMVNEIESMHKTSKTTLESTDYHRKVVEECDKMLQELNPAIAKEKEREQEMASLKEQMSRIEQLLSSLKTEQK